MVKSLSERQVIQIDKGNAADIELLGRLEKAIQLCAAELRGLCASQAVQRGFSGAIQGLEKAGTSARRLAKSAYRLPPGGGRGGRHPRHGPGLQCSRGDYPAGGDRQRATLEV